VQRRNKLQHSLLFQSRLKENFRFVHFEFSGCGDLKIHDISHLPDPCPLPDKLKKRTLVEKERLLYAPFSGVGGIVYDKDAVYVELGGSHSHAYQVRMDNSRALCI
jgi:hypothetical protein